MERKKVENKKVKNYGEYIIRKEKRSKKGKGRKKERIKN